MGKFVPLHLNSEGVQKSFPIGTHQEEMLLMFCNLVAPPRRWHQRSIFRPHTFRHLFAVGEGSVKKIQTPLFSVLTSSTLRLGITWWTERAFNTTRRSRSYSQAAVIDVAWVWLSLRQSLPHFNLRQSDEPYASVRPRLHWQRLCSVYHVHSFSPRERGCLEDLKYS